MRNPTISSRLPTIDYSQLLGRMAEKRYTRKQMAKAIGVSETAFGKWILRGELMHGTVVWALSVKLNIPTSEFARYFYSEVAT